jgi:hypothetical protein
MCSCPAEASERQLSTSPGHSARRSSKWPLTPNSRRGAALVAKPIAVLPSQRHGRRMTWTDAQIVEAHEHCFENVREVQASNWCVCYFCAINDLPRAYFEPAAITEWLNPAGRNAGTGAEVFRSGPAPLSDRATAFCPNCTFDMVIGDASGFPINDRSFVSAIDAHFSRSV